jgi:acetolactate synthase-1/2/3 large subunit
MQLAAPDRVVIATMGDGSYMFANPVACHQIAEALGLHVLVLVLNNREWGAVRQSVLGTYPDGYAARTNQMPLVSLDPTPDFTLVARASRAWTARVEAAKDLPGVLAAAIEHVRAKRTQAAGGNSCRALRFGAEGSRCAVPPFGSRALGSRILG